MIFVMEDVDAATSVVLKREEKEKGLEDAPTAEPEDDQLSALLAMMLTEGTAANGGNDGWASGGGAGGGGGGGGKGVGGSGGLMLGPKKSDKSGADRRPRACSMHGA